MELTERQTRILSGIDYVNLKGIEYGPLHTPILTKDYSQIDYVDFASQDYLRAKYKDDPNVNVEDIPQIDIVLSDRPITDMVPTGKYDFVIASHVLEHVPNFIGWLRDCDTILTIHGQIALALPDRRFTFDYLRMPTKISDVLAAFVQNSRRPSSIQILDFLIYSKPIEVGMAWNYYLGNNQPPMPDPKDISGAMAVALDSLENGTYHDVHCWVFSDVEFCKLMLNLCQEGFISFGCDTFFPTPVGGFEFYCTLKKMKTSYAIDSWKKQLIALDSGISKRVKIHNWQFTRPILSLLSTLRKIARFIRWNK
jgi:hypothetical protein